MSGARRDRGPGVCGAAAGACGDSGKRAPAPRAARPVSTSICAPVTYGGEGRPQLLIVNIGPLQGPMSDHGVQNAQAVKMVLAQRGWRAGELTVGLQVCDEASAASPLPDPAKCARIAKAFAAEPQRGRRARAGHVDLRGGDAPDRQPGARRPDAGHQHVEHLPRPDAARARASRTAIPTRSTRPASAATCAMVPADDVRARQALCTRSDSAYGDPTSCITTGRRVRRGPPSARRRRAWA